VSRFLDALGIAALLALVLLTVARAEPFGAPSRMTLEGPTAHCFAVVAIENRVGVYHRDETLETDHGPVVVNYTTVGGHKPGDDDRGVGGVAARRGDGGPDAHRAAGRRHWANLPDGMDRRVKPRPHFRRPWRR